jgi:hypothetical protein
MNTNLIQIDKVKPNLSHRTTKRSIRKSVLNRYRTVARQHPQWVAALFDEHFVITRMIPMLEKAAGRGEILSAAEVANEWSSQLNLKESSQRELEVELTPLVAQIIYN